MVARGTSAGPSAGGGGRRRRAGRLVALGAGAATLVPLLSGCDVGSAFGGFGWPRGVTPQADRMHNLWIGSVIAALIIGFIVWGLIFWSIIRYRKRSDELPVQTRYNLPIEAIYTILPFLIISVLFYYTAVTQTYVDKESPNPDVTVEVVAFQWNWQFNYRDGVGPDAKTVASTIGSTDYVPVLVLPTGKTIRIEEHSNDVIHSFWVPELLFKRDVFPGNVRNSFQITLDKTGAYVGRCAELCGTYHSMMNFELRAVTPEQYATFLADKEAGMSTPEALKAIGEAPYATTTKPFPSKRDAASVS